MSVTFGFYNSVNGDRKYDAIQMSSIFDGIIRDGVFQHLGTAMMVEESEGMIVNVGIGRAWFNHTWTLNDALLPLEVPISEVILNRIDAVVLEVDARENSRANSIKIVKGTPASSPKNPEMIKTNDRWQYPLAYIQVNAGVTSIRQANITNCVGISDCPFINQPMKWRNKIMNMSNKTYDVLKWIAQFLLPAAGTLYFALAGIWGLPYGEQVVGTITAVDTFLGVLLGISSANYNKAQ